MEDNPSIYHITHVDNLPAILGDGFLWSDGKLRERGGGCEVVGMASIKQRRLESVEVACHPGTKVGEYVPFYFCSRSIMLYLLHCGNHPELDYRGGQRKIVHLRSRLRATIRYADANGMRWSFSDRNAAVKFAKFFSSVDDLEKIDWNSVRATYFQEPVVKEGKQAEFLIYESFPWELVETIGVFDTEIAHRVEDHLSNATHKPLVRVQKSWYF